MRNTQSNTTLNPVQLHLLQMFSYAKTKKELTEVKSVLLDFYRKKVDAESDKVWKAKKLTAETMDELLNSHNRTPYK